MPKKSNTYNRKTGILFLSVYFTFILLGTLHYHVFDFENNSSYSTGSESYPYTDLTSDFFSICSLHQFSQTIDDIHFSSSDVVQSLAPLGSSLFNIKINYFLIEQYSTASPRAPPFFIS
jgi:hypothetical protein